MTPLDSAYASMEAAPEDDSRRLAFYGLFADTELYIMLADEADDGEVRPALFDVEGANYLVAFDREDRLTGFTGEITPYAALPGRGLAAMIAGEGIGIALNAELPSAMLIPPDAVDWLSETLAQGPSEITTRPQSFHKPLTLPDDLMSALDASLVNATGLAAAAWLAGVTYDDGVKGHVVVFAGAAPGAEQALAATVREALVFSGHEEGWLDVAFLAVDDPILTSLADFARALPLPLPEPVAERPAPGSDPARPPRLR